jgi:hypothetical protein
VQALVLPTSRTIYKPLSRHRARENPLIQSQSDCGGVPHCHHGPAIHFGISDLFTSQQEDGDKFGASPSVVVEGCVQHKVFLNGASMIQDRLLKRFQSLRQECLT